MTQNFLSDWKRAARLILIPATTLVLSLSGAAQAIQGESEQKQVTAPSVVQLGAQKDSYKQQSATIPRAAGATSTKDFALKLPPADYLADMKEDGFYSWPADKCPVKVFFQSGKKVAGYKSKFRQCLQSCFNEWTEALNGKLAWIEVSDPTQANIVVRWTNTATERAEGTEAGRTKTYATLNTRTNHGTIHAAEMLLLTRLPEREFSPDEVRRAYLHEVGHAFGIAGHSHNPNDIMYYAVTQHASPHLDDRDRATINHLYNG